VPIEAFPQFVSLRLTPEGDVFSDGDGAPSRYAPGHGDLTFALRRSGALERFRSGGGELLFVSNVDNLPATLDEAVIGAHIASKAAVTVECVAKEPGDKGGAPALFEGRVQIIEAFRFPEDFDQDSIGVFNTNTLVLDAAAIDREFDLSWFAVEKEVSGRPAIQLEHLVGQLTAFLPSHYLRVEREGPSGRFAPVKDPAELERIFDEPVPTEATNPDEVIDEVERKLLPWCTHVGHPGYFGLITPSPLPVGVLGDLIASALNQNIGTFTIGPSAVAIERRTVRWPNSAGCSR